jgi:serine protease Do
VQLISPLQCGYFQREQFKVTGNTLTAALRRLFAGSTFYFCLTLNVFAIDTLDFGKEFNADSLTKSEIAFLQAGLALFADYDGKLDGVWNPKSQAAMEKYFETANAPGPILNWVAVYLAFDTDAEFWSKGWASHYLSSNDLTLLLPFKNLDTNIKKQTISDNNSSLEIQFFKGKKSGVDKYHTRKAKRRLTNKETARDEFLWTTIATFDDRHAFIRSERLEENRWATIAIYANEEDLRPFRMVVGSIIRGNQKPIAASDRFEKAIDHLVLKLERVNQAEERSGETVIGIDQEASPTNEYLPAGTVFAVSSDGYLATSFSAVEECKQLQVEKHAADLIATDQQFDLALIRVPGLVIENPATFASAPVELNSDVTVAGYPLSGLLGGLNMTRGAVSSLKGVAGDGINVQISAPIQPGDAGGPVVNSRGAIVGVVGGKLNAKKVAELTGDIPQNINFAIRGQITQLFLFQNGITPLKSKQEDDLNSEEIATLLSQYTYRLDCL